LTERVGVMVPESRAGDGIGKGLQFGSEGHVLAVADIVVATGSEERLSRDGTEVRPAGRWRGLEVLAGLRAAVESPAISPGVLGVRDADVARERADGRAREDRAGEALERVGFGDQVGVEEHDDVSPGFARTEVLRDRGSAMRDAEHAHST